MTTFAADDFAYIRQRQAEIADGDAANSGPEPAQTAALDQKAIALYNRALGGVAPPSWFGQTENVKNYWRNIAKNMPKGEPLTCFTCNHQWRGNEDTDDCPSCHKKNPTIPF